VVGYECLVGHPPFDNGDAFAILMDHVQSPVPRPPLATSGTAEERSLYATIERLLAKDPDDRFQNARELTLALESGASTPSRAAAMPSRSADPTIPAGTAYAPVEQAPRSSAALDAALAAGVEMLRQQKPKVDAGVAAGIAVGRRLLEDNAPRMRSAAAQASEVGGRAAVVLSRAMAYTRAHGRRVGVMAGAGLAASIMTYYALHFAIKHRSRCPVAAEQAGGDSAGATAKVRGFTVLVDGVGTRRQGSDIDVYYDVCGMPSGSFKTRIAVVKQSSGLQRLLGGSVAPVVESYEETASTPAIRRHRTLSLGDMPPGTYSLAVVVTDAKGRRREAGTEFDVSAR
jgi:hypothetical protein